MLRWGNQHETRNTVKLYVALKNWQVRATIARAGRNINIANRCLEKRLLFSMERFEAIESLAWTRKSMHGAVSANYLIQRNIDHDGT